MKELTCIEDIEKEIKENEMILLYFKGGCCSVCTALKPKVEEMMKKYEKVRLFEVNGDSIGGISPQYSIFSLPAILFFIDGHEILREARNISLHILDEKIGRYYSMYYK